MPTIVDPVQQARRIHHGTRDILNNVEEANEAMTEAAEIAKAVRSDLFDENLLRTELGLEIATALEALIEDIEGTSASAFEWERFMKDARNLEALAVAGRERTQAESGV